MSWALDWLQLPHDADERTIKRAYAARLKNTRPDSDPEGFQQLHEVYQAALAWSRYRGTFADADAEDTNDDADSRDALVASTTDTSADDAPEDDIPDGAYRTVLTLDALLAATGAPSTSASSLDTGNEDPRATESADARWPQTPAADTRPARSGPPLLPVDDTAELDIHALCAAIIEQACFGDVRSLMAWLHQRDELWSLQAKPRVGAHLIAILQTRLPPIGRDTFDALLGFFGLDQIGFGQDPYTLQILGERMQLVWEQQPARSDDLARRVTATTGVQVDRRQVERMLDMLRRPYRPMRALRDSAWPRRRLRVRALLQTLGYGVHPLPADISGDQVAFWLMVSDRQRMTRLRATAALLHCAAAAVPLAFLAMLVAGLAGNAKSIEVLIYGVGAFVAGGLSLAALWTGWVSIVAYLRWQGAPEEAIRSGPWLRLFWVPALALLAMVTTYVLDAPVPGTVIAVIAVMTALARYSSRRVSKFRHFGWVTVLSFVLARSALPSLTLGEFTVVGALLLWTLDLWFHRHSVRLRR